MKRCRMIVSSIVGAVALCDIPRMADTSNAEIQKGNFKINCDTYLGGSNWDHVREVIPLPDESTHAACGPDIAVPAVLNTCRGTYGCRQWLQ